VSSKAKSGQHLRILAHLADRAENPAFLRSWLRVRGERALKDSDTERTHRMEIVQTRPQILPTEGDVDQVGVAREGVGSRLSARASRCRSRARLPMVRLLHGMAVAGEVPVAGDQRSPTIEGQIMTNAMDRDGGPRRVLSASSLKDTKVRNPNGDDLGKIEEVMLDQRSGKMAYAVLSFGGFLGMGDKLFAIPWRAINLDQDEEEAILDVQPEVLENAPGFDKDHWPDFADPQWGESIHAHYDSTPYWEGDVRGQREGPR
jgi:sporulation protein YlmC with PRC-barrel domain